MFQTASYNALETVESTPSNVTRRRAAQNDTTPLTASPRRRTQGKRIGRPLIAHLARSAASASGRGSSARPVIVPARNATQPFFIVSLVSFSDARSSADSTMAGDGHHIMEHDTFQQTAVSNGCTFTHGSGYKAILGGRRVHTHDSAVLFFFFALFFYFLFSHCFAERERELPFVAFSFPRCAFAVVVTGPFSAPSVDGERMENPSSSGPLWTFRIHHPFTRFRFEAQQHKKRIKNRSRRQIESSGTPAGNAHLSK